jgi:outer membrane protein assembly factor BamB
MTQGRMFSMARQTLYVTQGKFFRHVSLAVLLAVSLSSCSLFSKKAKPLPPTPLKTFQATVQANVIWQVSTGSYAKSDYVKLHPVVDEQAVYIAGGRTASAWNKQNGAKIWQTPVANIVTGGVNFGEGSVFLGTGNGNAIALDARSGQPRWVQPLSSEVLSVSSAAQGMVVFRTTDGKLHGLSVATGEILWQQSRQTPLLSLRGASVPLIAGDKVIAGFDDGKVAAFDLQAGHQVWEAILAVPRGRTDLDRIVDIDGKMSLVGNTLYAATYHGQVASINAKTGSILWSKGYSTDSGLVADVQSLYTANDQGDLYRIAATNGAPQWKMDDLVRRQPTAPSKLGNYILVGDYAGYLHLINVNTGQFAARLRGDKAGYIASPLIEGNQAYILGRSGVLTSVAF